MYYKRGEFDEVPDRLFVKIGQHQGHGEMYCALREAGCHVTESARLALSKMTFVKDPRTVEIGFDSTGMLIDDNWESTKYRLRDRRANGGFAEAGSVNTEHVLHAMRTRGGAFCPAEVAVALALCDAPRVLFSLTCIIAMERIVGESELGYIFTCEARFDRRGWILDAFHMRMNSEWDMEEESIRWVWRVPE